MLIMGSLMAARWKNARNVDAAYCDKPSNSAISELCDNVKDGMYDFYSLSEPYEDGHENEVEDLKQDIQEWDLKKQFKGSRFEVIFGFTSTTLIVLSLANLCMAAGAWVLHARLCGLCLSVVFGLCNSIAIIVSGVFRFNSAGKLASLSLLGCEYEG